MTCTMPLAVARGTRGKPAGSNVDLASTVSSEFEEVRLEDMEHSGSGEEVDWAASGQTLHPVTMLLCAGTTPILAAGGALEGVQTKFVVTGGEDEVVEQKQPEVVGKNVSAPRPVAGSGSRALSPAQPQRMSSPGKTQQDASGKVQEGQTEEEEPELSWRGRRQGVTTHFLSLLHWFWLSGL